MAGSRTSALVLLLGLDDDDDDDCFCAESANVGEGTPLDLSNLFTMYWRMSFTLSTVRPFASF